MGRVIAVVNQKGGVSKSSLSVNLGIGLARQGKKVLLCDLDPQSDLTASLGFRDMDESSETVADLMLHVLEDEPLPEDRYIVHSKEKVDILPSNIALASMEIQLTNALSREFILKQVLADVRDQYDYCILDNMPSLGLISVNALAAADEVIVPVEVSYLPIRGLQMLMKTIGKVRRQINPRLTIGGIVFTLVDIRTREARENMQLIREAYGDQIHIFDSYIPYSVKAKECCKEGVSIFQYDPSSKVAEAYGKLTQEVIACDC